MSNLGNNLYGAELFQVLQAVKGSTKRMSYILMDKINSAPVQNIMLRQNAPIKISNCLNELGVFGAYVRYVITCPHSVLFCSSVLLTLAVSEALCLYIMIWLLQKPRAAWFPWCGPDQSQVSIKNTSLIWLIIKRRHPGPAVCSIVYNGSFCK